MYENWLAERWSTPFSDADTLVMISLVDDGSLQLVLENDHTRWSVRFEHVVAYRNLLEEYRLELWQRRDEIGSPRGWSWRLTRSDWLDELREREPLVDTHAPEAVHYLIATQDDVVEVFTAEPPIIDEVGSAEDDARIEEELARLQQREPKLVDLVRRVLARNPGS
ncbi:MAG: hypothetical protein AAGD14_01315 [Planctomycetota bacterium]